MDVKEGRVTMSDEVEYIKETELTLIKLCPKHYDEWNSDRIVAIPITESKGGEGTDEPDELLIGTKLRSIEMANTDELLEPGGGPFIPAKLVFEDGTEFHGFWCMLEEGESYTRKRIKEGEINIKDLVKPLNYRKWNKNEN